MSLSLSLSLSLPFAARVGNWDPSWDDAAVKVLTT